MDELWKWKWKSKSNMKYEKNEIALRSASAFGAGRGSVYSGRRTAPVPHLIEPVVLIVLSGQFQQQAARLAQPLDGPVAEHGNHLGSPPRPRQRQPGVSRCGRCPPRVSHAAGGGATLGGREEPKHPSLPRLPAGASQPAQTGAYLESDKVSRNTSRPAISH